MISSDLLNLPKIINRWGEPSKLDQAPFATQCKVFKNNHDLFDVYLQISHDEINPNWIFIGTFDKDCSDDMIVSNIQKTLKI